MTCLNICRNAFTLIVICANFLNFQIEKGMIEKELLW